MADNMDIYKSLNISIGTVMKNLEMLQFVADHLKTKTMCKHAVKKLPYLLRYVPDQYKTPQICNKAILENGGTLKSVSNCYKNQEMCNKAVDKTQEMCNEAVNRCFFVFYSIPDQYKTQEILT